MNAVVIALVVLFAVISFVAWFVLKSKDQNGRKLTTEEAAVAQELKAENHDLASGRSGFRVNHRIHGTVDHYRIVELVIGAERYGNVSEALADNLTLTTGEVEKLNTIQQALNELIDEKREKVSEQKSYKEYETFHYQTVRIYDTGLHRVSDRLFLFLEKQGESEFAPLIPTAATILTSGSRVDYNLLDDEENEAFTTDVFGVHRVEFRAEVDKLEEMNQFLDHYAQICHKIKRISKDGDLVMAPPSRKKAAEQNEGSSEDA